MFVPLSPPALVGTARVRVQRWAESSQRQARRNAMIASTECAQRRAEREEVEYFFAALLAPRRDDTAHRTARA
jgi:hypothetical protein